MIRPLLVLVLGLSLAGCATPPLRSDVTRFHTLDGAAPRSFTIVADTAQVGSLEFQDYASRLAGALTARGWRPVPPGQPGAETLVGLHWGVGQPSTVTWQSPAAISAGGVWGPRSPWHDPFPYWETHSATSYPHWLAVEMVAAGDGRRVLFEGRAVADGGRSEIAPLMPALIQALMTGFPGVSGGTVQVAVPAAR